MAKRRRGTRAERLAAAKADLERWLTRLLRAASKIEHYRREVKRLKVLVIEDVEAGASEKLAPPAKKKPGSRKLNLKAEEK